MDTYAILLAELKYYHRAFVVSIIDQVIEEVIRGIERNDFKEA